MTGRAGPGPNSRSATPGVSASVAPTVASSVLRQLLSGKHRGRLIRLELRPRIGADRQHFGEMQIEIDRDVERRRLRADGHFGATRAVALGAHADVILAWRHVLERERAIVAGAHFAPQFVDHDERAGEWLIVARLGDLAAQGGAGLRCSNAEGKRQKAERRNAPRIRLLMTMERSDVQEGKRKIAARQAARTT